MTDYYMLNTVCCVIYIIDYVYDSSRYIMKQMCLHVYTFHTHTHIYVYAFIMHDTRLMISF